MNDLYRQLNRLNGAEDIEPMDVTPEENERIKAIVKRKMTRKHKPRVWRGVAIAASISLAIITSFPAVANQIPLVNDIFNYFNDENEGFYDEYEKFSTGIEQTETSNGITVTVDHAVYDGRTVTLTFALETDHALGEHPGFDDFLDVKKSTGAAGTADLRKVGEKEYVGLVSTTPHFDREQEMVSVNWEPRSFWDMETGDKVEGDWKFQFTLHKVDDEVKFIQQSTADRGVEVVIDQLRVTDISTVIEYRQIVDPAVMKSWEHADAQLSAKDNLGNVYEVNGNGGYSKDLENFHWSATMGKIHPDATRIIFTPEVVLSKGSGLGHQSFKLDPIEVNID